MCKIKYPMPYDIPIGGIIEGIGVSSLKENTTIKFPNKNYIFAPIESIVKEGKLIRIK